MHFWMHRMLSLPHLLKLQQQPYWTREREKNTTQRTQSKETLGSRDSDDKRDFPTFVSYEKKKNIKSRTMRDTDNKQKKIL